MKSSIKNIKYFFLFNVIESSKNSTSIIKNKKLFEFIFLPDNEKTKKYLDNMINRKEKLYLNPLDIITGGIPRFALWQSYRFISNTINLTTGKDLFVDKNILVEYGEFQRNRLIDFLKNLENGEIETFNSNVILDMGLDLLAFGEKSSIFYENIEILHRWIDEKIINATYDPSKISFSYKVRLINLKLQLLEYMPPILIKETLNALFSKLTFLFTPFKTFEVIKNFDNMTIINLYNNNKNFQDYMEDLKKNINTDPEKKEKYENISKALEHGLTLPFSGAYNGMDKVRLKDNSYWWYRWPKDLSKFFDFNSMLKPITDKIHKYVPDLLTKSIDFSQLGKDMNFEKLKISKEKDHIFLKEKNTEKLEEKIREIKYIRDNILFQNAIYERLQEKNMFIPAFWMEYIIQKCMEKLEEKLVSSFESMIASFTLKASNPLNDFIETIIITKDNNIKIEYFLKLLTENMKKDGPLPSILICVKNSDIEALIKNYVYSLIKQYPISKYKIINPFTATKFKMNKLSKKNLKPKEFKNLANKIFYENINGLTNYLKILFLHEELKYMSWISRTYIEILRSTYNIFERMENILYIGKKIFKIIEISGLELLCGSRSESKQKNTKSMATSTFVTYVTGILYKDKFIFAFASHEDEVDEAVKSRFTINCSITKLSSLETYMIFVRRALLELMGKHKNILLLNQETFEKLLVDISYEFYIKNWTGNDIKRFFIALNDENRLKIYNYQYNKEQIKKLMNEVIL